MTRQRPTVYNHLQDENALFGACQGHWLGSHPPPDRPRRVAIVLALAFWAWTRLAAEGLTDAEAADSWSDWSTAQP